DGEGTPIPIGVGEAGLFASIAPVGHTERQVPQEVQIDSRNGLSMNVPMRADVPAPRISIAPMNWGPSRQPRAQRPHRMHESIEMVKNGLLVSRTGCRSRGV